MSQQLGASTSMLEFLPNLPGYRSKDKASTKKTKCLSIVGGQLFVEDPVLPTLTTSLEDRSVLSIGNSSLLLAKTPAKERAANAAKYANMILTFQAYFEESTIDDPTDFKIRKCAIYFYLENGAIMIVEKAQSNSGLAQGKLVKKSILLKNDGSSYTPDDFHLGQYVVINNRRYFIVDCDKATRDYMQKTTGVSECDPIPIPDDPYLVKRRATVERSGGPEEEWGKYHSKKNASKAFWEAMFGNAVDNSGREGFMRYGNNKLVFKCVWDNTNQLYGDRIEFNLQYFLADDTVQILTIPSAHSGKDQFSRLLKKSKLPKELAPMTLEPSDLSPQYWHWAELYIGLTIDVYARRIRIVDVDSKTRDFYEQYGMPLGPAEAPPETVVMVYEREIPPHIGIGSEEDTLRSCNGPLQPGPAPTKKLRENTVLSFFCALLSGGQDDVDRRFVLTFYVQDSTIKIQEPPVRNSGFTGGVFLSRRAIKAEDGEPLTEKHLYVGCKLRVLKHLFRLLETNESTMRWLEDRQGYLPRASFYKVLDKIRGKTYSDAINGNLLSIFQSYEESPGFVTVDGLKKALSTYELISDDQGPNDVSDHELLTIMRGNGNRTSVFNYVKLIEQIIQPTDEFK